MTAVADTARTERAVRVDRWDVEDWEDTRAVVKRLEATAEQMAETHEAGPDVLADVFASVFKREPELEAAERITPDRVINRAVIGEFMESADYPALHHLCAGDRVQSALTTVAMANSVAAAYERVGDKVEQEVSDLQEALDALDKLTADPDADPVDLADAEQAVQDGQEALDGALEPQLAGIGRDVRQAAQQARNDAEQQDAMLTTWGQDPGQRTRMDPESYLSLAQRLRSPRLVEITKLFGAMRNLSWGARRTKVTTVPEEVHSVTLGDDISRVLPSELMALAMPELEDDFYLRLFAGELLSYELRGVEREGQGAILYLEDGSLSMRGARDLWAKGVGLALLGIAKDQGRAFHAIHFGGKGQITVFSFPEPAAFTTERMLAYAETFIAASGTDFETPLIEAIGMLDAEHAATGKATADIVLATDGDCNVSPAWLAWLKGHQQRLGITTYGLAIGATSGKTTLADICDQVADVRDLHSGDDVRHVFAGVS